MCRGGRDSKNSFEGLKGLLVPSSSVIGISLTVDVSVNVLEDNAVLTEGDVMTPSSVTLLGLVTISVTVLGVGVSK